MAEIRHKFFLRDFRQRYVFSVNKFPISLTFARPALNSRVGVSAETLLSDVTLSGDDKMTLTTAEELVSVRQESENLRVFTEPAFFHPLERVIASIEKPV